MTLKTYQTDMLKCLQPTRQCSAKWRIELGRPCVPVAPMKPDVPLAPVSPEGPVEPANACNSHINIIFYLACIYDARPWFLAQLKQLAGVHAAA
jgi:hypothetical protein